MVTSAFIQPSRYLKISSTRYISGTRYGQYGHTKMMTPGESVAMGPRMGRKKRWPERVGAKFACGTLARIAAVLRSEEHKSELQSLRQLVCGFLVVKKMNNI